MTSARLVRPALVAGCCAFSASLMFNHTNVSAGGRAPIHGLLEPVVVPIISKLGGTVTEVAVHPAERVRQGQMLVRFDNNALDARQHRMDLALRAARTAVESSRLSSRIPSQVWTYLADTDPRVVSVEKEYAEALSALDQTPAGDREKAQSRLEQAARKRTQIRLQVGHLLRSASSQFPLLLTALREQDRELALFRSDTEVRAPADSVVEILGLHPGDRVLPGSAVALLALTGEYTCDLVVRDTDGRRMRAGTQLEATISPQLERITARVESVSKRTVPFTLRENPGGSEQTVVRARINHPLPLHPGTVADFQLP